MDFQIMCFPCMKILAFYLDAYPFIFNKIIFISAIKKKDAVNHGKRGISHKIQISHNPWEKIQNP